MRMCIYDLITMHERHEEWKKKRKEDHHIAILGKNRLGFPVLTLKKIYLEKRKLHSSATTPSFYIYCECRDAILLRGMQITLFVKVEVLTKISKKSKPPKILISPGSGILVGSTRRKTPSRKFWLSTRCSCTGHQRFFFSLVALLEEPVPIASSSAAHPDHGRWTAQKFWWATEGFGTVESLK